MKHNVKRHAVIQPLDQSIRLIPLTQGFNGIVDATDYEFLMQINWGVVKPNGRPYAVSRRLYMHRYILNPSPDQEVDHINGDTLDNRRANLRVCSRAENSRNTRKRKSRSKYKGITLAKWGWAAQIVINGKCKFLGHFKTEEEAHLAYAKKAVELHGEFANLGE